MTEKRLIVGLGNPGIPYTETRHNLGFLVVDKLAALWEARFKASRSCRGVEAQAAIQGCEVVVLKPLTFMNRSGGAVRSFLAARELALKDVLVVCDDFQLDFGQLRLRRRGSDGGHNGLSSVIECLQSDDFPRLRMGIGPAPSGVDAADFVLDEFTKTEKRDLSSLIDEGVECCSQWISEDIETVMGHFNKRKEHG